MKRKNIAAANWKMNTTVQEGLALLQTLTAQSLSIDPQIVICAPATHLHSLSEMDRPSNMALGAQNMYPKESGAYTGESSPSMLSSAGATYVIIGHSERREYFKESDEFLGEKLKSALSNDLTPIFCCGEGLDIRQAGTHVKHVINQIEAAFEGFSSDQISRMVIAYEPIWAIGTGETASPEQAQEMHQEIRAYLSRTYGSTLAEGISILYGGSVKPANAKEIFGQPDVDGGLVGGASLKADSFAAIINSF